MFLRKLLLKKIDKNGNNFTQKFEMRISFFSSYRFMSFEHYLKQKMSICEIELNKFYIEIPLLIFY